ncbi:VWA domain-containing protein [Trichocoleus sp. FACHB-262]|uniref:VWA domain-containing protein n=1 Tax=Trichocoleus sp. FACHB-262 TaxID=2692869 RepID=UPI00168264C4|nr:VWA domain-containing protein [Trichocoleus sp. FACHB-262]MBD2122354.1 VWA domain-containing protein [Trichocoleus sp. FACHB-262]
MKAFDPQDVVLRMFLRLRSSGFQLGVSEYFAALNAIKGGFAEDLNALAETLKLLWCHSLGEQSHFEPIWQSVQDQISAQKQRKPPFPGTKKPHLQPHEYRHEVQEADTPIHQESLSKKHSELQLGSLPVQAPYILTGDEEQSTPQAYYPISRRLMVYSWRYLRRLIADGPADVLDIQATIQRVTRQGFYIAPVYVRRERNAARLLLLVDQNGSMTPFHHFTRDLVETAQQESSLDPENVKVFYFQNVPSGTVYRDVYLTEPVSLDVVLSNCDNETSVLIVSDAGAARGYRTRERVRGTARFLYQLRRYTSLVAWLSPMSARRWVGSSAEIIANSIPMFQMDKEGLSNAIDVIRGQPWKHSYSSSL